MSFGWDLSDEAQASLVALPIEVQERAIDELDRLENDPTQIALREHDEVGVVDVVFELKSKTHYLFFLVRPNHSTRLLKVQAIGHFERA